MDTNDLRKKYRKEHNKYVLSTTKSGMPVKSGSYSDDYVKWLEELLINKEPIEEFIQADIRNRLSPMKNLCSMLRNSPRNLTDDENINNMIFKEVKNVEDNVKYLSNLEQ